MSSRAYHLKRKYNLTLEDYEQILNAQANRCPICLRRREEFKTNLCVDHNHKSGEVRGILCTYCNKFIIGRHTDYKTFERAAQYLRGPYTGIFVPPKVKKRRKKKRKSKR